MARFRFNKLVRDKIVELQKTRGTTPRYHILDGEAHVQALLEKLTEEANEARVATSDELIEEIADVQQVLEDLKRKLKLSDAQVLEVQKRKNEQSGAFSKGIFIEEVTVPDTDEWAAHFRANPDRYPEIKT